MIALNKLVKNTHWFKERYKLMGKKENINSILDIEKIFTKLQIQTNEMRSTCNKLCSSVADKVNNNEEVNELVKTINHLDHNINKNNKHIANLYAKINKKLNKLPNPAINKNTLNELISTTDKAFTKQEFEKYIKQISDIKQLDYSIKRFFNLHRNYIFENSALPIIIKSKQTFSIFGNEQAINEIYNNIVELLKLNSKFLILKSIKSLHKDSCEEYFCTLSDKTTFEIRLIGEFKSREYGIKIHDESLDMSLFMNQIDIHFN